MKSHLIKKIIPIIISIFVFSVFPLKFSKAHISDYDFQYISQSDYPVLSPGESIILWVKIKNKGTATWTEDVVRLGTSNPRDRISVFRPQDPRSNWLSDNRIKMDKNTVAPGEEVGFGFWITAPTEITPGIYREYFCPVADGITWMKDIGIYWDIIITTYESYNLKDEDSNKTIEINKGDNIIVTLRDRGDGGYVFDNPQYDSQILKLIDHQDNPPAPDAPLGDFGTDTWTFLGIEEGSTDLLINIYHPWEKEESIKTIFELSITVKEKSVSPAIIDYGTDFDSFIQAAENCTPARVLFTSTLNLLGVLTTSTVLLEIKGIEMNKCIFYQKTQDINVQYSEELVQQLLDSGMNLEEIEQLEQNANQHAQESIGTEKICKFDTEDLTAMLNRWKQGNFSTEDWEVAQCE